MSLFFELGSLQVAPFYTRQVKFYKHIMLWHATTSSDCDTQTTTVKINVDASASVGDAYRG